MSSNNTTSYSSDESMSSNNTTSYSTDESMSSNNTMSYSTNDTNWSRDNSRCSNNSRPGNRFREGGSTIIDYFSNVSIKVIGVVVNMLDTTIRESDRVGTLTVTGSIIRFCGLEVRARVIISNTVLVGVGGDLVRVNLSCVNCMANNTMSYTTDESMSSNNTMSNSTDESMSSNNTMSNSTN